MKTINTLLFTLVILALTIFSCTKKPISNTDNENNQKYSRQLEMNYETNQSVLSASTNENEVLTPTSDRRFETAMVGSNKFNKNSTSKTLRANAKDFKVISESHPLYKMVSKRVEKISNNQKSDTENAVTGRLRTGIILAAIGLVVLLVGYFMPFPISTIFIVGGAILFIIGIVIILLDLL